MIDVLNCIADAWFRLGFQSAADMATAGAWVTADEQYQFADDAAKYLARESSLFLTYDASINVVAGTPQYAIAEAQVFTVTAWLVYLGSVRQLRLSSVGQLFALDASWAATTGPPTRLSMDAGAPETYTLYPNPVQNATLAQVMQEVPAALVAGGSQLSVSPVLQDYFTYALLGGARGKESDSSMPDMAAHFAQRCALYDAVIDHLWGDGQ